MLYFSTRDSTLDYQYLPFGPWCVLSAPKILILTNSTWIRFYVESLCWVEQTRLPILWLCHPSAVWSFWGFSFLFYLEGFLMLCLFPVLSCFRVSVSYWPLLLFCAVNPSSSASSVVCFGDSQCFFWDLACTKVTLLGFLILSDFHSQRFASCFCCNKYDWLALSSVLVLASGLLPFKCFQRLCHPHAAGKQGPEKRKKKDHGHFAKDTYVSCAGGRNADAHLM